ncbi:MULTISPECIES: GNAT family N-acetyltransferase [Thalassotalea]|uniref:GNAT family N-acetyltransferase n=1 Tax=Thalassotalea castellviae TaxID=3075612 RepID=A0ABU3A2F8_9GAMM|nr:GNAT family N-acetyltransferase [Thalassotalea sp. W431]MDT0604125.1 GNAT family N-acetyltransferase [Thalassotalea sp. W431]
MKAEFHHSINDIAKNQWQAVENSLCPLMHYEFFKALEDSTSICIKTGWQPHHLTLSTDKTIQAIIPLYIKQHSWGEYVFDWDWAQAYQHNGLDYYPKLVSTIPVTPIPNDKLLSETVDYLQIIKVLIEYCQQNDINSWHLLFIPEISQAAQEKLPDDVYLRHTVQFHWFNRQYQSFDHFLSTFTARKRKNTLKERRSIAQQDVQVKRFVGKDITKKHLDYFYLTYQLTYLKKGHQPHLSYAFFQQIFQTLPDNILLVIASRDDQYIACSLFFYDHQHLYGRYWGCSESVKNLHFELCYYQGIEFCIANKLAMFNPGTQGEHKIQRGFEAVLTYSYHWIKHEHFKTPIKNYCQQERVQLKRYQKQCLAALPFKQS